MDHLGFTVPVKINYHVLVFHYYVMDVVTASMEMMNNFVTEIEQYHHLILLVHSIIYHYSRMSNDSYVVRPDMVRKNLLFISHSTERSRSWWLIKQKL